MIRHVSVFTLKNKGEVETMISMLQEVATCPLIVKSEVGRNLTAAGNGPGPHFGDVIQIIDFNTREDLNRYPSSKEHQKLFLEGPQMEEVTAIDYEV